METSGRKRERETIGEARQEVTTLGGEGERGKMTMD